MKKRILSVISVFLSVVLIAPNVSAFGLSSSSETEQSAIAAMGELGALDIEPVESIPVIDETVESQASNEVETESSSESSMPISTEESTGMETSQEELELTTTAETSTGESLTTPSTEVDEEVILEAEPHTDDALVAEYAYLDLKMPGRQARSATTVRPYDVLADVASKSEIIGQVELESGISLTFNSESVKAYYPLAETISFEKVGTTYFVNYATASQDTIVLGYYEDGIIHKSIDLKDENNLVYIDESGGMIYPDTYFQSKSLPSKVEDKVDQAIADNDIATLQSIPEISVYQAENYTLIDKTTTQIEGVVSASANKDNYEQIIAEFFKYENVKFAAYQNKVLGSKTFPLNGKLIQLTVLETRDGYNFVINSRAEFPPQTPLELVAQTALKVGLIVVGIKATLTISIILAGFEGMNIFFDLIDGGYALRDPATFVTDTHCYYNFGRQVYYSTFLNTGTPGFDGPVNILMDEDWDDPNPRFEYRQDAEKKTVIPIMEDRFIDGEWVEAHVADWEIKGYSWLPGTTPPMEGIPFTIGLDEIAERAVWATENNILLTHFHRASSEVDKKINEYVKAEGIDLDITGSDVGDTWQTATSIMPEYTYYQNIDRSFDEDYYKFVVPENPENLKSVYSFDYEAFGIYEKQRIFTIISKLESNNSLSRIVSPYFYCNPLSQDENTGYGSASFNAVLEPGTYYLQISHDAGTNYYVKEPINYNFKISVKSADKVSNFYESATLLNCDKLFTEDINYGFDVDYYKFVVPENPGNLKSVYSFDYEVFGIYETQRIFGIISKLESNNSLTRIVSPYFYCSPLSKDENIGYGRASFNVVLEPGTYYLEVSHDAGTNYYVKEPITYNLWVSVKSVDKVSNFYNSATLVNAAEQYYEDINYYQDEDYYKFVVPENPGNLKSVYSFDCEVFSTYEGQQIRGAVYKLESDNSLSTKGSQVTRSSPLDKDANTGYGSSKSNFLLEPGTYYLWIYHDSAYNSFKEPISYNFKISEVSVDKVPNSFGSARSVNITESFSEDINYYQDEDYYKFVIPENLGNLKSLYNFEYEVFGTYDAQRIRGAIYKLESNNNLSYKGYQDTQITPLDIDKNTGYGCSKSSWVLEPGTYYIWLYHESSYYFKESFTYTFKASRISTDKVTNDYKSTDPSAEPVTIPSTSVQYPWFSEAFNYSGDIDCYKFTSYGTDSIRTLMTSGDADTYGTIYKVDYDFWGNPSYSFVRSVDYGGAGKNIKMTIDLPEGNYILELGTRSPAPINYGIFIDDFGVFD